MGTFTNSFTTQIGSLLNHKWFLAETITPSNCVAVYQPQGAVSLAESYKNLANPDTYDATPGVAPVFDPILGWVFDGTSRYLNTGIIPVNNQTWSMIVKYSGYNTGIRFLGAIYEGEQQQFGLLIIDGTIGERITGYNGGGAAKVRESSQGIIAVAGSRIYFNGQEFCTPNLSGTYPITAPAGNITLPLVIGAKNEVTAGIRQFFDGQIQAVAIYNRTLTLSEYFMLSQELKYLGTNRITLVRSYMTKKLGVLVHFNMGTFSGYDASPADTVNLFAPTGLHVEEWIDSCVAMGARYAYLTTKHYDGFALWPTAYHVNGFDPYSIEYANDGYPDIVDLFVTQCRLKGLRVGLYFNMHDSTYLSRSELTVEDDTPAYIAMVKSQLTELLTNYGVVDSLLIDGWAWSVGYTLIPFQTILDHVMSIQPNCLVIDNSHLHPNPFIGINNPYNPNEARLYSDVETYEANEGSIPEGNIRYADDINTPRIDLQWFAWETADQTTAAFRTAEQIKAAIVTANSRNGNYTLAITPDTTGHIPAALKTICETIGTL